MTSVSTVFQVPADILDTTPASPQTGKTPPSPMIVVDETAVLDTASASPQTGKTPTIEVDEAAVLDTAAAAPQVSKAPISR